MRVVVVALLLSNLDRCEDMPRETTLEEEGRVEAEEHRLTLEAVSSVALLSEIGMAGIRIGQGIGMTVCLPLDLLSAIKTHLPTPAS